MPDLSRSKEIFILWILAAIVAGEILLLIFSIHFSKILLFFYYLLFLLRLVSPVVLIVNIIFFIFALFGKGKMQTARSWKEDVKRSFRFFLISLGVTVAVTAVCMGLGMFLGISMERFSSWQAMKEVRAWVQSQLHD